MCYRYEQITVRHEISSSTRSRCWRSGENITFGDLKGTLNEFARRMYGADVRTRFRPSYFPFTEPSGEMDVECFICGGKGCPVCKQSGWLEILGCGMIHPMVLRTAAMTPKVYPALPLAWAPGASPCCATASRTSAISGSNDVRFLEQFSRRSSKYESTTFLDQRFCRYQPAGGGTGADC